MSQIRSLAAIATAAVLATAAAPARSQEIPNLNVDPVCRGIAQQGSTVAEKGSPDLAFSQCIQSEQAMRQKLAGEWSTFSPSEKANCIGATLSVASKWRGTRGS